MFRSLLVDATNRVKTLVRGGLHDVAERFEREVIRTSKMCGGAVPILCWDHPDSNSIRRQKFPEYKAERNKDEDREQAVRESLYYTRDKFFCWFHPDYEADDLIATLVHNLGNVPLVVHSSDSDMLALLAEGIRLQIITSTSVRDQIRVHNRDTVAQKYGINCSQFYQYRALVGDSSDNLPGVHGLGKKTALQILEQFPTVDLAVAAGDDLKIAKARREKLKAAYENGSYHLALELTTPMILQELPEHIVTALETISRLNLIDVNATYPV